jgi:hypothetical protein
VPTAISSQTTPAIRRQIRSCVHPEFKAKFQKGGSAQVQRRGNVIFAGAKSPTCSMDIIGPAEAVPLLQSVSEMSFSAI